jgi:hypothetical protein
MSRHIDDKSGKNVETLFMDALIEEEIELQDAATELANCEEVVTNCKQKIEDIKERIYQSLQCI